MAEQTAPTRWYHSQQHENEMITITMWPYRSLSPLGFRLVIAFFALALSALGLGFMLLGAWPVVGFLGLEIGIVWMAFKVNYRAGQLVERVFISPGGVTIERTDWRGQARQQQLDSPWVTAELLPARAERNKLLLKMHAQSVEIGAFLPPVEKPSLADALNDAFYRMRHSQC